MECLHCHKELNAKDEITSINGHGLVHSDDCFDEYVYENIVSFDTTFGEMDDEDKKWYFEDGSYNDIKGKEMIDIYINGEYFTTVLDNPNFTPSFPFPFKKYNGDDISIEFVPESEERELK